jgi:hypothetical protein
MFFLKGLYICIFLISQPIAHQDKFINCINVVRHGDGTDLDLYLAVASHESNFSNIVSNGNHGIFQIKPKFWCYRSKCDDLIKSGIDAILFLGKRYKNRKKVLCHYNRGNICDDKGIRYAKKVISKSIKIKRNLRDFEHNGMITYITYFSSFLSHFRYVLDISSI